MNEPLNGVGPHKKPWPTDEKYDKELLEHGDRRNVVDEYRYWSNAAIKRDLKNKSNGLHVAIENFQHDFNIGTIVRNANAFNVSVVHIIGKKQWNRRGAMVTDKYLEILHHASVEDFVKAIKDRSIVAIDNITGSQPLTQTKLPRNCVLVFGGEGPGISQELQDVAEKTVMIEQFGSTRSVNVGVASGIVMYAWMEHNYIDISLI